jgi:hypothetical protein
MPVLQVSSWVAACDVCRAPLHEGMPLHFSTRERLLSVARAMRWLPLPDGRLVCPLRDAAHQAVVDALLPPGLVVVLDGGPEGGAA